MRNRFYVCCEYCLDYGSGVDILEHDMVSYTEVNISAQRDCHI